MAKTADNEIIRVLVDAVLALYGQQPSAGGDLSKVAIMEDALQTLRVAVANKRAGSYGV